MMSFCKHETPALSPMTHRSWYHLSASCTNVLLCRQCGHDSNISTSPTSILRQILITLWGQRHQQTFQAYFQAYEMFFCVGKNTQQKVLTNKK